MCIWSCACGHVHMVMLYCCTLKVLPGIGAGGAAGSCHSSRGRLYNLHATLARVCSLLHVFPRIRPQSQKSGRRLQLQARAELTSAALTPPLQLVQLYACIHATRLDLMIPDLQIGCLAYEMLAGRSPFEFALPEQTAAAVLFAEISHWPNCIGPRMQTLISSCLRKVATCAYHSCHCYNLVPGARPAGVSMTGRRCRSLQSRQGAIPAAHRLQRRGTVTLADPAVSELTCMAQPPNGQRADMHGPAAQRSAS